ncbi:MAG: type I DNA topoisomerase [bacterium]
MSKSLVIVESDAKSKTINKFLGKEYNVKASVGHIKNLPKNRLGVDIENNFSPEWITIRGKGKILSNLKKAASASDKVFLATDPDREGEAIAYHLLEEIKKFNKNVFRVLFYEITDQAVREAIQNPKTVNLTKVEAQKARRVLDRLVGYKISPFLWKTIYRGLSAGRVQSAALRIICQREEEITSFKPEEYWSLDADFMTRNKDVFKSKLIKINDKDVEIPDKKNAEQHVEAIQKQNFLISDIKKTQVKRKPYPPYTTSSFQQDAAVRCKMSTKKIMMIAQQLYEGIDLPEGRTGLITYMRTDSTRLSSTAVSEAREFIANNYGTEYVPPKPVFYKTKKNVQDAHEAIRPTSLKRIPRSIAAHLTSDQLKIYTLIWQRFAACQMRPAQLVRTIIDVKGGPYQFRTTGSVIKFKGFMQVYNITKEKDSDTYLPEKLKKEESLMLEKLYPQQHFTKPSPRYTESSLVKTLDTLGIGRPSTYAITISNLLSRKYITKERRTLFATELGMNVNQILISQFPDIININFTAYMEKELDKIESGDKNHIKVLKDFYQPFSQSLQKALSKQEDIKLSLQEKVGEKCPECGKELIVKWGRNGKFIGCTGYPECTFTKPLDEQETHTDEVCERCGAPMQIKVGKFGRFLACSDYPKCKFTKPFSLGISCPEKDCDGEIVERKTRRGKIFYGCSNYPKCKFALWNKPVPQTCPKCGYPLLVTKQTKTKGTFKQCPNCKNTVK